MTNECFNGCGRYAVGLYYIGDRVYGLCPVCLQEQTERDEIERNSEAALEVA